MTPVFDPLLTGTITLDILTSGVSTPDAIAERRRIRLARLLDAARRGSRLCRERLRGIDPHTARLRDVPPVSRAELMARFDDWVTDPQLKLAEISEFTADVRRIGEPYLGKYMVWESSGTCHQPGVFVQDAQAMAVYDALEASRRSQPRSLQHWLDPLFVAGRVAFVGATNGHFASVVSVQRLRRLNPWMAQCVRCFSILQSAGELVEALNDFAPTAIVTYPTVAGLLADVAGRGLLRFRPAEIWTGGEKLSTATRSRVVRALGCAIRESFGASEFFSIGWECARGRMHANTDWVILEPVDAQGQPMPAGQLSHSTLLTNLANHAQPLIRYDLGDRMIMHRERCECGSPLPVIEVEGRQDDALVMAGRDGRPVTLLPIALTTLLEDEAGVFNFQLRQRDAHSVVLRLDMPAQHAAPAAARCRTALKRFGETQGLARFRIVVELGKPISRGRTGKAKRIVARPGDQGDPRELCGND